MRVERFSADAADAWDALVASSCNGTFLHSRRFLAHHGDRFDDRSLLVHHDDGRLAGVFPAATDPSDPSQVVSHPGLTYGAIVHGRDLRGASVLDALGEIARAYREQGVERLVYKPVPHVFHVVPAQDDLYALHRLGAVRSRCDLSAAVDLRRRPPRSARRVRSLDQTRKAGVTLQHGPDSLERFWTVLVDTLRRRHDVAPTHTVDEMRGLIERFTEEIALVTAHLDGVVVAGAVTFTTRAAVHTQYLASDDEGRATGALDLIISDCIDRATADGRSYFSFGISTAQGGTVMNQGLHEYKTKFGGGGLVHEHYLLEL